MSVAVAGVGHGGVALSPAMAGFVRQTLAFAPADTSLSAQRRAYLQMARHFTPPRPPGVSSRDVILADPVADPVRPARPVPVRCYQPPGHRPEGGWPAVLYLHGGGWMLGGLDSHEFITAALCAELPAVVLAVDYRLAPEHPFPAAFQDTLATWAAVQREATALGLDAARVAVAGDSAGGNLAAALCLALRDAQASGRVTRQPCGQALVYPALAAPGMAGPSHRGHAQAPLLSLDDAQACWAAYTAGADAALVPATDWRAAPLSAASLAGLPPAFVAVDEFDPVRDDGMAYARRLVQAGGLATLHQGAGLVHGCLRARTHCAEAGRLVAALVARLRAMLYGQTGAGP